MRENRQSGSEGGETFGLPYPYPNTARIPEFGEHAYSDMSMALGLAEHAFRIMSEVRLPALWLKDFP